MGSYRDDCRKCCRAIELKVRSNGGKMTSLAELNELYYYVKKEFGMGRKFVNQTLEEMNIVLTE